MEQVLADRILHFWFETLGPSEWFASDENIDRTISEEFRNDWEHCRVLEAGTFLSNERMALAAIILFDQFSRNMFRGESLTFSTDRQAREISGSAIELGLDNSLTKQEQQFLYMPFMHSENLDDQEKSLQLFTSLNDAAVYKFAQSHYDVIEQFGRFPHRNTALGRKTTLEEQKAIEDGAVW